MKLINEYDYERLELPNGRVVYVNPLLFGRARINISNKHFPLIIDIGY